MSSLFNNMNSNPSDIHHMSLGRPKLGLSGLGSMIKDMKETSTCASNIPDLPFRRSEYIHDYTNADTPPKRVKDSDTLLRIVSWNVRGLRSFIMKNYKGLVMKDPVEYFEETVGIGKIIAEYNPAIICLQETRLSLDNWDKVQVDGWRWFAAESKGSGPRSANRYSGTAILISDDVPEPLSVITHLPALSKDEGRITAIEFEQFYMVNVYVPNSGSNEDFRNNEWYCSLLSFLDELPKRVIICGDFNVARSIYDMNICEKDVLKKTKNCPSLNSNEVISAVDKNWMDKRISNFMVEERLWINNFLASGFTDIWRSLNPDVKWDGYTMVVDTSKRKILQDGEWDGESYSGGDHRRIDYFFTRPSDSGEEVLIESCVVLPYNGLSSDHMPIYLECAI